MAKIGSFVTKDGRVIRAQIEDGESRLRQRPSGAEEGMIRRVGQAQYRPAQNGPRSTARTRGFPKLAAIMLLGIIFILVLILVLAGIKGSEKHSFSREKVSSVIEERVPRVDSNPVVIQEPASEQPRSYSETRSRTTDISRKNRRIQKSEALVYEQGVQQESQREQEVKQEGQREQEVQNKQETPKQEMPLVSSEPVVNYHASIEEMKNILDARSAEMERITGELRNIGGSDQK